LKYLLFLLFAVAGNARAAGCDSLFIVDPAPGKYGDLSGDNLARWESAVDSIASGFFAKADSLRAIFREKLSALAGVNSGMVQEPDSLAPLAAATAGISAAIDSLRARQQQLLQTLNEQIGELKQKTIGHLEDIGLPDELLSRSSKLLGEIQGYQLPLSGADFAVPGMPDLALPFDTGTGLGHLGQLDNYLGEWEQGDILARMREGSAGLSQLAGPEGALSGETGNLSIEQLSSALENRAVEYTGLSGALRQQEAGGYEALMGTLPDAGQLGQEALEQVQELAYDHFAAKQETLRQAMDQMEKIKNKYESFSTLPADFRKGYNEMKGRPLKARLIPGISVQLMKDDFFMTDLNVYAAYRITGLISAGLGWNQRIVYDFHDWRMRNQHQLYGPRFFAEYKLKKGFYPRLEVESMCTGPEASATDQLKRQWIWGGFVGIKKDFGLVAWLRGTAFLMFNAYEALTGDHRSPYTTVVNARIGVEFPGKHNP
jgi:hypothetical protein